MTTVGCFSRAVLGSLHRVRSINTKCLPNTNWPQAKALEALGRSSEAFMAVEIASALDPQRLSKGVWKLKKEMTKKHPYLAQSVEPPGSPDRPAVSPSSSSFWGARTPPPKGALAGQRITGYSDRSPYEQVTPPVIVTGHSSAGQHVFSCQQLQL